MIGDLEYSLNWLYGFTTSAYLYDAGADTTVAFPNVFIDSYANRRHKRTQMAGLSFAKTFTNSGLLEGLTIKKKPLIFTLPLVVFLLLILLFLLHLYLTSTLTYENVSVLIFMLSLLLIFLFGPLFLLIIFVFVEIKRTDHQRV